MADDEIESAPPPPVDVLEPEDADDPEARLQYFSTQRRAVLRRRDESPDPEPPPTDDHD